MQVVLALISALLFALGTVLQQKAGMSLASGTSSGLLVRMARHPLWLAGIACDIVGFVAQAAARRLVESERPGSIINVSSQMGHVGAARRSVYCASKHAMEGFTKAMAIELAPHRIRVNTLAPTFIETPMTRPFFANAAFRAEVLSKIKLGRLGQLDDLTGAIVFLASDASALMTGSSLVIDGGWTAE